LPRLKILQKRNHDYFFQCLLLYKDFLRNTLPLGKGWDGLFLFFLFFSVNIFSQKPSSNGKQIFISKAYTEHGEPIGLMQNNRVETGKTYSLILSNGRKDFIEHLVFLYVEKHDGRNSMNQFVKLLRTEKGKTWIAFNYSFSDEGIYDVYFTDFTRKKIASVQLTVKSQTKRTIEKSAIGEANPSLNVIFCEQIIGGNPINYRTSISLTKDGGEIYVYISDTKPLGLNKLMINIWKKKENNEEFDEFVDSKKYNVNMDWHDTFFKYQFESTGEYKINVFNENEILLKTAYIAVEK